MTRWLVRSRWLWLAAAGLAGGLLAACAQPLVVGPAGRGAAAEFEVAADRPGNRVTVTAGVDRATFEVWSATGIGSAEIRLMAGVMPADVLMRFHLRGLEQLSFAYDDTVVSLSVPSGAGRPVWQSVSIGGQETVIGPESPYWMALAQPAAAGEADTGFFEVAAPPAFLTSSATSFTLGWIDFFR